MELERTASYSLFSVVRFVPSSFQGDSFSGTKWTRLLWDVCAVQKMSVLFSLVHFVQELFQGVKVLNRVSQRALKVRYSHVTRTLLTRFFCSDKSTLLARYSHVTSAPIIVYLYYCRREVARWVGGDIAFVCFSPVLGVQKK